MNTTSKTLPVKEEDKAIAESLDIKEFIRQCAVGNDPEAILRDVVNEMKDTSKKPDVTTKGKLFKAMTLLEFEKGTLIADAVPEKYSTFCIDFSRNLQKEFNCETPSEKATAELIALNFVRVLSIQYRMDDFLSLDRVTHNTAKYFDTLSKELDRANRHYINALQTLKMLKHPAFEVNIKAQTAVVGQNQIVQTNNK